MTPDDLNTNTMDPTEDHPYPFNEAQGAPPKCRCEWYRGIRVVPLTCEVHQS